MDMTSLGIASVAAITVICFLVGEIVKAFEKRRTAGKRTSSSGSPQGRAEGKRGRKR